MRCTGRCSFLKRAGQAPSLGLALALLRAWLVAESKPASDEDREWLRKVSPICLKMIEAALPAADTDSSRYAMSAFQSGMSCEAGASGRAAQGHARRNILTLISITSCDAARTQKSD